MLTIAIDKAKKSKQTIYIVFLDVEKAFDKAYLPGILEILHKNGLKDRNWCIMKNINEDNEAIIKTHVGYTRTIQIKENLKQGGVLSGLAYSTLTDEIAKKTL